MTFRDYARRPTSFPQPPPIIREPLPDDPAEHDDWIRRTARLCQPPEDAIRDAQEAGIDQRIEILFRRGAMDATMALLIDLVDRHRPLPPAIAGARSAARRASWACDFVNAITLPPRAVCNLRPTGPGLPSVYRNGVREALRLLIAELPTRSVA